MKKFFSLLCATLLVFSASAAPQAKKAELAKKAPVAVEQVQKVQFEKAQIADFNQLSATPAVKVNNFKPQALAKVSQATQAEPIVVIIDGTPSIQPAGDVQAITVIGKDNMVYAWGVKTTSLEAGKTYAFTDMSTDYTYRCSQDYFSTFEDPTDATFSIDAENNITASIVTESGTYMVYTKAPQPEPVLELAEKYTANGSKYDGTSKTWIPQQSWTLKTSSDKDGNYLNGILPALASTYPVSYTVEDDSVLVIQPGFVDYQSGVLVSIENASAEDGCIRFIAGKDKSLKLKNSTDVIMYGTYDPSTYNFLGTFGQYTSLTYTEQAPITERDTVDVISAKMTYDDFIATNAAVQYYAGDDAGYAQFCVTSKNASSVFGTFDVWADYSWINFTETTGTDIQEGQITVTEAEDGVHLTGYVIGNDEKYYRLNWFMEAGILPSDTDAPFDATFAYSDMSADLDEGVIGIYATNAEGLTIGLELYADPAVTEIPAGVYTISDSQEAGTALQSLGVAGGYLTECYAGTLAASGGISDCWFLVEGTITLEYDEYDKLKVVVNGTNSWGQPVTALVQYVKLEPKSTVDIVSTNLSYTDEWYAEYGIQEFVLTNNNYGVLLDIFADTLVGEFTEDDVDLADSYIVDFNTGAEIPVVNTGDIVVTLDGKNLTLTTTLIGADTIQYNISATGYLGYIQGDAVEGYVGEFAVEEVAIQQVAISKVNYIYIAGTNAVGDQLALVVKGELEDGAIAAGTYTEVMACTGFDEEGQINPSYVGNNAGVWFIQSGKLIIAEDGSMAFLGVNSYDAPVAIDFTVPVTGLRNAKANMKAAKRVANGQIVIVRENKEYNILGAAL